MADPHHDAAHDLGVLIDVAKRMGETFELEPLLRTIETAGRTALACDRATIFLYDPQVDELFSKVATGISEIRFPAGMGIAGEAARSRTVIHVPDAYADSRFNPAIDRQTGYRTRNMLTLPLIAPGDELIGVLQVLNKLGGGFTENDLLLAGALGSLTGIAIKRQMLLDEAAIKQRLEQDLSMAREIQQQLLPRRAPRLAGFDIAGWNKPADQTGGDLYDFMPIDEHRLAIMIADATGHGIGPALIVAECRALFRAMIGTTSDLAEVAARMNDLLHTDLPEDRFVTVCMGLLDARTGILTYVSAGHGPLLLMRSATGKVEQFSSTGLPMGILAGCEMPLAEPIRMEPGDLFVLLTDGFIEWACDSGEQYGDERLAQVITAHPTSSSGDLIQTIYRSVLEFGGHTPQMDDLTAVLIRRIDRSPSVDITT
jgi:phosphoserine phosphatase RsbU/P